MEISILGTAFDTRTNTPVVYLQCSIPSYLKLVGEEFFKFSIQRKREKFAAYARLKSDILAGTLLPTITLAAPTEKSQEIQKAILTKDFETIKSSINTAGPLSILDGLQRTYILKEILDSGHEFPESQTVHLEVRAEPDLDHLIYRIIVLNAGQKPMSMRHQIDILSLSLKATLIKEVSNLELVPEVDGGRRTKARKFSLDRVAAAYHAYLIKSPEVDKQNLVAQKLSEQNVMEQDVDQFGKQFSEFVGLFKAYCQVDDAVESFQPADEILSATNWLGNENTINAFFAAAADFGSTEDRKERITKSLDTLIQSISNTNSIDMIGLANFQQIIAGFPSRKTNIGYATRRLLFSSFKEFFREEGAKPLKDIWEREAE